MMCMKYHKNCSGLRLVVKINVKTKKKMIMMVVVVAPKIMVVVSFEICFCHVHATCKVHSVKWSESQPEKKS